jgi:hypothetical protein
VPKVVCSRQDLALETNSSLKAKNKECHTNKIGISKLRTAMTFVVKNSCLAKPNLGGSHSFPGLDFFSIKQKSDPPSPTRIWNFDSSSCMAHKYTVLEYSTGVRKLKYGVQYSEYSSIPSQPGRVIENKMHALLRTTTTRVLESKKN